MQRDDCSQPGQKYAVEYTGNLTPPRTWTPLVTNTGVSTSLSHTNATTNSLQRYFRLRQVE
jgi:hypothetical protein